MTAQNTATNRARFEDGDKPSGSHFADLVDSFVNKVDTTAQSIASELTVPNLVSNAVSAGQGDFTTMSAATYTGVNLDVTRVSATTVSGKVVVAGSGKIIENLTVSGRATTFEYLVHSVDTTVAALGTTQGSAKVLGAFGVHHVLSVSTGQADAIRLLGAHNGLIQYIVNWTTGSAKMFPATGGQINSAAANAAYDLYPQSLTIVVHGPTSSQYTARRLS